MKRVLNLALKNAIFASGKTQKRVATLARLSEKELSLITRGHREASPIERARLAKVLGKLEADLFGEAA